MAISNIWTGRQFYQKLKRWRKRLEQRQKIQVNIPSGKQGKQSKQSKQGSINLFENLSFTIIFQLLIMSDPKKEKQEDHDEVDEDYDPEAPVVGDWKLLDLPEVPVVTGEEEEEVVWKARSKIYRWRAEWKERGVGELKLLKHKKSELIRILVRAQKTHKCLVNHFVQKKDIFCNLEQMKTSNNAWTWAAYDISDEKPQTEKLCAKFTSKEDFEKFKEEFDKACQENSKVLDAKKTEEGEDKPAQKKEDKPAQKKEDKTEQKKEDKTEQK